MASVELEKGAWVQGILKGKQIDKARYWIGGGKEREGGAMDGFLFSGSELSTEVRQVVGGTGLGMLNFRCLGLLKGRYSEVTQASDVMKFNANKRNNSPNCFGIA